MAGFEGLRWDMSFSSWDILGASVLVCHTNTCEREGGRGIWGRIEEKEEEGERREGRDIYIVKGRMVERRERMRED